MRLFTFISYLSLIILKTNFIYSNELPTHLSLQESVLTSTEYEKENFLLPQNLEIISEDEFRSTKLFRTIPEALKESPGILTQKTGHAQGSPFIRGFTGFRNLFLIDGIRLNNSVFRDGPNQYWNTVDAYSLSKIELSFGPSAVLYGSDSIGGTLQVRTKPLNSYEKKKKTQTNLFGRYASAEQSTLGRIDIEAYPNQKLGMWIGNSLKKFGDLKAGAPTKTQSQTGYDEQNFDFKLSYTPTSTNKITLFHQNFEQDNAWRTHKTIFGTSFEGTSVGSELMRSLDQNRKLSYLQYEHQNLNSWIDHLKVNLSLHTQKEDQERKRNSKGQIRQDDQGFDVDTYGSFIKMNTQTQLGLLSYGIEHYYDKVNSYKREVNLTTGQDKGPFIQGPVADDAKYESFNIYIHDDIPINEKFSLSTGLRWTSTDLEADKVEDPSSGQTIKIEDNTHALVGQLRSTYLIHHNWNLFAGISQSFRAPNLSDLTRLDTARSNEIETPVPGGLNPEKFLTWDIGTKLKKEKIEALFNWYYTEIEDMIIRTPTGRTIGTDAEVTKKNSGNGYVSGFEFNLSSQLTSSWYFSAKTAWQSGKIDTFLSSTTVKTRDHLSRTLPWTSVLSLKHHAKGSKWWIESLLRIADRQNKLSARDQGDTQRIPPGGTPGYQVITLRGGYHFNRSFQGTLILENLTDEDYRIHGSGLNEAGFNTIIGLNVTF